MHASEIHRPALPERVVAPMSGPEKVEVEVVGELGLSANEAAVLDLHSFFNILTILLGELHRLRLQLEAPEAWDLTVRTAERVTFDLRTGGFGRSDVEVLERVETGFDAESQRTLDGRTVPAGIHERISNVRSVLRVLAQRLAEYAERLERPDAWVQRSVQEVEANLAVMLAAVEKNSHGRYRIVANIARQRRQDYVVDFRAESDGGATLTMPIVIQDVLRDLVANARKYSSPGAIILAGLHESCAELTLVVEDDGMGIPPDEIARVPEFGYRATNVRMLPTNGGGFGLTKALWVTRRLGGRMWIRSQPGAGTRITIRIPVPPHAR